MQLVGVDLKSFVWVPGVSSGGRHRGHVGSLNWDGIGVVGGQSKGNGLSECRRNG